MKRILKILGLVVGVVVLLLVVAGVAITMLFDPNDYKDDITAAVQSATGRQLTLAGDLTLEVFPTIRIAISRAARHAPERFRIVHYSVQSNHVHLIVEAAERRALTAGVHGLEMRITRYVNDLLMRRGSLWADRWHGRALKSPREARNALVYVLANFRKHASRPVPSGVDPCSSGTWFHGWHGVEARSRPPPLAGMAPPVASTDESVPVAEPKTWLLRKGFLRAGRVKLDEAPRRG